MLPTEKNKPKENPLDYTVLLYGPTKVGKTTFASHADSVLFLATEPGVNALEVYSVEVPDWKTMLKACAEIAQGKHSFKTVVIDTIDNAYSYCMEYVCKENGWSHPSDGEYGKGWAAVSGEFKRVLLKLAYLPYGLLLISHSQEKEITTRTGNYTRITTTLPESARKIVVGLMDVVLLAEVEAVRAEDGYTQRRVLRTKPMINYDAGDRTGRLPETLPLDYPAFLDAFTAATATKEKQTK